MTMKTNYNRISNRATAYFEIDLGGKELSEVEFTGYCEVVNNGIGSYECHGYKGNDNRYEPEVIDYKYNEKIYTAGEIELIEDWLADNDNEVCEKLIENFCDNN